MDDISGAWEALISAAANLLPASSGSSTSQQQKAQKALVAAREALHQACAKQHLLLSAAKQSLQHK
jgi:hypothetical protein